MTNDTIATSTKWTAWQRIPPSKRWEKICEADSEDECRQRLWALPWQGSFRDVVFLPENIDPNRRVRL
ncbi:MAG: hypothetical protein HYS12_23545 [Planctomycetes bacterium]|nr:hypothetical protein [Planctomycetota bacterium]